ncbi:MAG: single-stranded-DNA-specific exonuclease RecJ [Planctomycetota bacterium]
MQVAAGMQKKQWVVYPADKRADELGRRLGVSPVVAQVLINRQVETVEAGNSFINPKLSDLIAPERMAGTGAAIERIVKAVEADEKITIYGDYDVDGITGTAILWHMLKMLGGRVDYYIPHRIEEGYGLNAEAIKQIAENGTGLIITVDCGITARESIRQAYELGMEVIVTDHHQINGQVPEAAAVVHPGLDSYENPDSAGATVAFKLAWGIANKLRGPGRLEQELRDFLVNATMFAAMGTVADIVDLRGENRIITSFGLKALPESTLPGIRALVASAGLSGQEVDSYHVGFHLGPMLNAAGRMGHARLAVELLTSDNEVRSVRIAEYLKEQNRQRQQFGRKMFKKSCEKILSAGLDHPNRKSIVLAEEDWHGGIIGITASRIVDKYCKPTILISSADGVSQGSGRSIEGFNLFEALQACSQHLVNYGGHSMAAGITLKTEKIGVFAEDFEIYAKKHVRDCDIVARLQIDAVCSIGQFRSSTVKQIQLLGPFGKGNSEPVFASKAVHLLSPPKKVGQRSDHLQLTLSDNTGAVRCIAFGMGHLEKKIVESDIFHVAYRPKPDTYSGGDSVQFVIEDIQFE